MKRKKKEDARVEPQSCEELGREWRLRKGKKVNAQAKRIWRPLPLNEFLQETNNRAGQGSTTVLSHSGNSSQ
jgi:hypothetical protein